MNKYLALDSQAAALVALDRAYCPIGKQARIAKIGYSSRCARGKLARQVKLSLDINRVE